MNPQSLADLLPCPMCGGEAHFDGQGHIACKTGWPCVMTAYFNRGTAAEQNAAAITAWNTRQAAAEVRGGGWLPIESAPRDGSVFLAWRFYAVAVKWTGDAEYPWEAVNLGSHFCTSFGNNGFVEGDINLTHWQPLPSPPGAVGEG